MRAEVQGAIFKLELRIIVCAVKENRRSRLAHRVVGERDPAAPAARAVGIGAVQQHVGVERSLPQQKNAQGWPKALVGRVQGSDRDSQSTNTGPSRAIRANPVKITCPARSGEMVVTRRSPRVRSRSGFAVPLIQLYTR